MRFLRRHWAGVLITILSLVVLLTLYHMWRVGWVGALLLAPLLAICLALIGGVLIAKKAMTGLTRAVLGRSAVSASAQAAQEAVTQGLSRSEMLLRRKMTHAKGTLSALGEDAKHGVGRLLHGTATAQERQRLPRCPMCNRYVRVGARFCDYCGAALPVVCPQCGRVLRAQARFCDGCGAPASTAS